MASEVSMPEGSHYEFAHIPPDIVVRPFKVVLAGHEAEGSHYEFVHIPPDIVVRPFKVVLAGHEAEALSHGQAEIHG